MEDEEVSLEQGAPAPVAYEPPRIERTLTADDLAREVQYAGAPLSTDLSG